MKVGDRVRVLPNNEYDGQGVPRFAGLEGTITRPVSGVHDLFIVSLDKKNNAFDTGWALYARELEVI